MSRPRKPPLCPRCKQRPIGNRKAKFCFDCVPHKRNKIPTCRSCGSTVDYYAQGQCHSCFEHDNVAIAHGCSDCHSWGMTYGADRLCRGCAYWRKRNQRVATCKSCDRKRHLGHGGFCRLCWRCASAVHATRKGQHPYVPLDIAFENRNGSQLFFAEMSVQTGATPRHRKKRRSSSDDLHADAKGLRRKRPPLHRVFFYRQLGLFDPPKQSSWETHHGIAPPVLSATALHLRDAVDDHAKRHGWSSSVVIRAKLGMRMIIAHYDNKPITSVSATLVTELAKKHFSARPVIDILDGLGMLDDDRTPAVERWVEREIAGLPEQIQTELRKWFSVLHDGSSVPPRSKPRSDTTIEIRFRFALPIIRTWVQHERTSLREITREDVINALPAAGNERVIAGTSLRMLFRILKAHKMVFLNPTARIDTGCPQSHPPLPASTAFVRTCLDSDDPTRAAIVALISFHGLRSGQVRNLQLTDVADHRIHVGERSILLAPEVQQKIQAYLAFRSLHWPATNNSHFFVSAHTAPNTSAVGARFVWLKVGTSPQKLREDRILEEAQSCNGDIRRLCDMFGLSVQAATRYAVSLDSERFETDGEYVGSRTQG